MAQPPPYSQPGYPAQPANPPAYPGKRRYVLMFSLYDCEGFSERRSYPGKGAGIFRLVALALFFRAKTVERLEASDKN